MSRLLNLAKKIESCQKFDYFGHFDKFKTNKIIF